MFLFQLPQLVTPSAPHLGNGPLLTSTPHRQVVVTQAEVYDQSALNTTQPLVTSNGGVVGIQATTSSRRGGGEVTPGGRGPGGRGQQRDQTGQDDAAQRRRGM